MSTPPVLSVSNLTTSFWRDGLWRPVVRGVSFDVAPKEVVAVVGESGSGKSVTALSIMRLVPETNGKIEGKISLAGRSLLDLPEPEMRKVRGNEVAMIFQEPMTSLNPVLTIGFQIAEALILHRGMSRAEAEAETIRLLEKVRIPAAKSRFHEYPHRFSGGMRQRVMIAMALACKPKLLIADEPTTALDVTIQAQILDLIKLLQHEEGMAVLFITHDMGVVAEIADRTVVMYNGEAVEPRTFSRIRSTPTRARSCPPCRNSARCTAMPVRCAFPWSTRRPANPTFRRKRRTRWRRPNGRCSRSGISSRASTSIPASWAAYPAGSMPWRTSPSACMRARRWRSSASRAAANQRPAAPSCG